MLRRHALRRLNQRLLRHGTLDLAADILFNIRNRERLPLAGEHDRSPILANACCPAYAMNIVFRLIGDIIIDDMAHIVNMNAPGRNICLLYTSPSPRD